MSIPVDENMDKLRNRWNDLYRFKLPMMAKERDPAQKKWPVFLDHCFARIILDNAVGKDQPWTSVVKSPAVRSMTQQQLTDAIELGNDLVSGTADLVELDETSLQLRGKSSKTSGTKRKAESAAVETKGGAEEVASPKKRQKANSSISKYFMPSPSDSKAPPVESEASTLDETPGDGLEATMGEPSITSPDMTAEISRIATSNLTPFRKLTLALLCLIPRGRYSTYQAMSDYITSSSHKTCARAVGNAMRNNPFAPEVPCHRILAADGSLGGFGGHWGENGKFASKKHELLFEEGVRFDSKMKVKGPPFRDFYHVESGG